MVSNRKTTNPPDGGKKTGKKPSSGSQRPRLSQLTHLEKKIVTLLQQHAEMCLQLGGANRDGLDRRLADLLSRSQIDRLVASCDGPIDRPELTAILRELVSAERNLLRPERVAFLGPPHSYSHLATLMRFGSSSELIAVASIATVFEEVANEQVHFGVVPIENSTDGRITDTLDNFTKTQVKICGEVPLAIHHNLLGQGKRAEVTEVCSKPQALSQCRQWLAKHMPGVKLTPTSSTTTAAKRAAKNSNVAAIASHQAGVEYGLKVLGKNIEDNKHNVTRFAVIGSKEPKKTGNDKTSLMFELKHEPGALATAMNIFKNKKLNLTWIESFPKPGSPSEYYFFVELLGHQSEARVKRALASLEKKSVRLVSLGSYPVGSP